MVIKLKDADFSANNLGVITIDRELTADAVAVLSHYTKSLTKLKQLAVDDFIANLKSAGIWSKFSLLSIPVLAGTLNECFYDIISNTQVAPASTSAYSLATNGLKLNNTTTDPGLKLKSFAPATNTNFHVASYQSATNIGYPTFVGSGSIDPYFIIGSVGFKPGENTNYFLATADPNSANLKGAKIGSIRGTTVNDVDVLYSGIPTVTRISGGTGVSGAAGRNIASLQHIGYSNTNLSIIPFSLISLGTSLTLAQMQTYNTYLDALMDLLIV